MRMGLPTLTATVVLLLALGQSAAAGGIVSETVWVVAQGSQVIVRDQIHVPDGHRPFVATYWPGSHLVNTEPVLPKVPGGVRVPTRVSQVQLTYEMARPSAGASLLWARYVPTRALWMMTGSDVTLPVELNQSFYAEGNAQIDGVVYARELAQNLPARAVRLNFEFAPPPPATLSTGLWILLVGLVVWTMGIWLRRRPRRGSEGEQT